MPRQCLMAVGLFADAVDRGRVAEARVPLGEAEDFHARGPRYATGLPFSSVATVPASTASRQETIRRASDATYWSGGRTGAIP